MAEQPQTGVKTKAASTRKHLRRDQAAVKTKVKASGVTGDTKQVSHYSGLLVPVIRVSLPRFPLSKS